MCISMQINAHEVTCATPLEPGEILVETVVPISETRIGRISIFFSLSTCGQVLGSITIPSPLASVVGSSIFGFRNRTGAIHWDERNLVEISLSADTNNDYVTGPREFEIIFAIGTTASDATPNFQGVSTTVTATIVDDEVAGYTVTPAAYGTILEGVEIPPVTVVLDEKPDPSADVTMTIASQHTDVVTLAGSGLLTFTSENWAEPQSVAIASVDDDVDNGLQDFNINVAVLSSGGGYDTLAAQTRTGTVIDNEGGDLPGLTITPTMATITEGDFVTPAIFTMALEAEPDVNVTIHADYDFDELFTFAGDALVFTPGNWAVKQEFILFSVDNEVVNNNDIEVVVTFSVTDDSDTAYQILDDQEVTVTVIDDEVTGFTLTPLGGASTLASIAEGGNTTFTAVLDKQPTSDVVLTLTSSSTVVATVVPTRLTFTTSTWNTVQTVNVSSLDNNLIGDLGYTITIAVDRGPSGYDTLANQEFPGTVIDNDGPGFTINEIGLRTDGGISEGVAEGRTYFTVVLDTTPSSNVELTVHTANAQLSLNKATLTFTAASGTTTQTVNVVGVEDGYVTGALTNLTITVGVIGARSAAEYTAILDETVLVNFLDNDLARIVTDPDSILPDLAEGGSSINVQVSLLNPLAPASDQIVLTVTSSDPTAATVVPSRLTFTSANAQINQPVMVNPVDDITVDGNQGYTITIAATGRFSSNVFPEPEVLTGRFIDDEVAGFTLTPLGGASTLAAIAEGRNTTTFTLVLDAQPQGIVIFNVRTTSSNIILPPTRLTLTPSTWNIEHTMTVISREDNDYLNDDSAYIITVSVNNFVSDRFFYNVPDQTLNGMVTDDDVAAVALVTSPPSLLGNVDEEGEESRSQDNILISLSHEPDSEVVVSVSVNDPSRIIFDYDTKLTFTSTTWDRYQYVYLHALKDTDIVNNAYTVTLDIISGPANYAMLANKELTGTIIDSDPGFTTTSMDLTVSEGLAAGKYFTVVLDAAPLSTVELTVHTDRAQLSLNKATLTFTTTSWEDPQTVSVVGVEDDYWSVPIIGLTITVGVIDTNSDTAYASVPDAYVRASFLNSDLARIVTNPDSILPDLEEGGSSFNVQVRLLHPLAPGNRGIIITVTRFIFPTVREVTYRPSRLTFTGANATINQTVTVNPIDDITVDGSKDYSITVGVSYRTGEFSAAPDKVLRGTVIDNDVAGFTLTPLGGASTLAAIAEGKNTTTFTLALDARPQEKVLFSLRTASSDISLSSTRLTLTPDTWNSPQTVTVTSRADNDYLNGDGAYTVTIRSRIGGSDDFFRHLPDQTLTGRVTDDDVAGFTLAPAGGSTLAAISEGGSTTFTVRLKSAPPTNVTLSVKSNSTRVARVSVPKLVFSFTNWDVAQTVSVRGVEDNIVDGTQNYVISAAVESGSDASYRGVAPQQLSGQVTNADIAGFTLTPPGGASTLAAVAEGRKTTTFTLALDARPQSNVVFDIGTASSDISLASTSVVFTRRNWNIARTIAIRSRADNNDLDGDAAYTVTVSVNDGESDNFFDDLPDQTLNGMVTDDDVAGFTLSPIGGSTLPDISENGAATSFTIVLDAEPASDVVITVTDTSTDISAEGSFTFTPANWDRPQTNVIVATRSNRVSDPRLDYTVTVSVVDATSNDAFDDVPNQELTGTFLDNDSIITVTGSPASRTDVAPITEGGTADNARFSIVEPPVGVDVILTVTTDSAEVTLGGVTRATINSTNVGIRREVLVTPVDDNLIDGPQSYTITVAIVDGGASGYTTALSATITGVVNDNDVATIAVDSTNLPSSEGDTGYFVISLPKGPIGDVVMDVTSSGMDLTISPPFSATQLTFTGGATGNWATPQTIMVNWANENIGDSTYTITVSVDDNSDNAFDGLSESFNTTITDDDTAGFILSTTALGTISEDGGSTSFDVELSAIPRSNVVLTLTNSGKAVSLNVDTLTFTTGNSGTEQTIMVSGVDNDVTDGDLAFTVTIAVDASSSDSDFRAIVPKELSGTVSDDDVAGFSISPVSLGIISEDGRDSTSFNVVLTAQPSSSVVITLTSSGKAVSLNVDTLTFTSDPGNWNTEQTVMVSGVDNDVTDGDLAFTVTVAVVDALSDNMFDGLIDQEGISGIVSDDDIPGFDFEDPSDGSTLSNIDEGGDTTTFIFNLNVAPVSGTVVIDLTSSDPAIATVAPAKLTLTDDSAAPNYWDAEQTVTVTSGDDNIAGAGQNYMITIAVDAAKSSGEYAGIRSILSGTVNDADTAGFTLSKTALGDIIEDGDDPGGSVFFTVILDTQPNSDVVLTLTSSGKAVSLNVDKLTFNSVNWDDRQTVTVSGVDNEVTDVDLAFTVTVAVDDDNSDDNFDGTDQELSGTVIDDDIPGFDFDDPSDGSTLPNIDEGGDTTTFIFDLNVAPVSGTVVIDLTSSDPAIATVAPAKLTLTDDSTSPNYWDSEQTVTVTSGDDNIAGAGQNYMITVAVDAANSSGEYAGIRSILSGTVNDADTDGFTLSTTALGDIIEDGDDPGGSVFFTVILDTQPNSDVVLTLTSSGKAVSLNVDKLTFNTGNWSTEQTVTVSGVDNEVTDVDLSFTVTVAVVDIDSDANFGGVSAQELSGTVIDDDIPGFDFELVPSDTIPNIDEGGTTTFTFDLNVAPASGVVVIDLTSSDPAIATVVPAKLTFTDGPTNNWDTEQTVTVTSGDDNIAGAGQNYMITVAVDAAKSSNDYDGIRSILSGTVNDDDVAGITFSALGSLTEGGSTTFTAVLDAGPASDVVLTLTSSATSVATVTPALLTFTNSDWSTAQAVRVSGVDNTIIGDQDYTITVAVSSGPGGYGTLANEELSGTVTDDDTADYTLSALGSLTEGGSTTFTAVLDARPASDVVLTLTSSDTDVATVAPMSLTFTNSNWNSAQTVNVTGVNNDLLDGSRDYTITVASSGPGSYETLANKELTGSVNQAQAQPFTVVGSQVRDGATTTPTLTPSTEEIPTGQNIADIERFFAIRLTPGNTVTVTNNNPDRVNMFYQSTGVTTLTVHESFSFAVNSNETLPYTLRPIDNDEVNDEDYSITIETNTNTVTLTGIITDDEAATAAINLTPASTLPTVTEGQRTSFTAALAEKPASDVVITLTSSATDVAIVAPAQLTFTNSNWNTVQTVVVSGVNNAASSDMPYTVTLSVTSGPGAYGTLANKELTGSVNQSQSQLVSFVGSGIAADERTIRTLSEPDAVNTANVDVQFNVNTSITITNNNPDRVILTNIGGVTQSVTFTPARVGALGGNAFIVIAIDNDEVNDEEYTIIVESRAVSSLENTQTITLTGIVTDDEAATADIVLSPASTLPTVTEGQRTSFTAVLAEKPASDVVITLTSSATDVAIVAPATLTFTNSNWNTVQTVVVSGVNNAGSSDMPYTVTIAVESGPGAYGTLANKELTGSVNQAQAQPFTVVGTQVIGGTTTTPTLIPSTEEIPPGQRLSDIQRNFSIRLTPGNPVTVTNNNPDRVNMRSLATGTTVLTMREVFSFAFNGNETTPFSVGPIDNDEVNDDDYSITIATNTHTVTLTGVFADDEVASIDLTPTALLPAVTEGAPTSFTAVLGEKPASDVVITLTSSDTGVATVAPATLTFTNGNWDTARTVDVTTVDNAGASDMAYTVTLSVTSGPGAYDTLVKRISGTARDKDSPSFILTPSDNLANIDEDGGTTTFTVVLDKQPVSGVVVFDLSSSAAAVATVVPAKLTFTSGNWNREQTGTVTAVDNDTIGAGGSYMIMAAIDATGTTSDEYDRLPSISLNGEVTEDDVAGFTLNPVGGSTLPDIVENGAATSFTVVLDAEPASNVVITVTDSSTNVLAEASFTFTPANWNTPQFNVVLASSGDSFAELPEPYTVTVSVVDATSDDDFHGLSQELTGTLVDNEIPSININNPDPSAGLASTAEGGSEVTFSYVLDVSPPPGSDVVMTVTTDSPDVMLSGALAVTYTSANYNSDSVVTVTPVDDDLIDGTQSYTITVAVVSGGESSYTTAISATITGSVDDNDVADIVLSRTTFGTTLLEDGSNSTFFAVSLDAQPNSNVVLTVTSSGKPVSIQDNLAADVDILTFTPDNWDTRQLIFISAVDNNFVDSVLTYMITVGVVASSSDASFRSVVDKTISGVAIMDDDVAGFTPSRTALGTISEDGGSTSFTVVLTAQPRSNVVLTLTNGGKAVSLNVDTLTFTSATGNWETEQTIMVSGVDNDVTDGDLPFMVTVAVDASSDDDFDSIADQVLSGTVSDDEVPGFKLNPSGNLANIDKGGQTTFTVVLNTEPVGDGTVVIALTSSDNAIATVAPAELTFTGGVAGNWETAQTGTVTAVDDNTIDGDENYTITVAVDDVNSSSDYHSVSNLELSGTVTNNDMADFTLSETTLGTISEAGGSTSFTVVLDAGPSNNVVLTLTKSGKEVSLSTATLTFTSGDWDDRQTIMVSGVDNDSTDGDLAFAITVGVDDGASDDSFDGVANQELSGIVSDDDIPGFQLNPSVNLADILEGGGQTTFTVVLNTQPANDVVIDLTSSDPAIATVAPAKLTFTNDRAADNYWDTEQTVTVTSGDDNIAGAGQNYMITVAVDDAKSSDDYDGIRSTLSGTVNDADTAGFTLSTTALGDIIEDGDDSGGSVFFTVILDAQPSSNVVLTLTSSGKAVSLNVDKLTFNSVNWDDRQTVTVSGVDNEVTDVDLAFTVTVAVVDALSDDNFDGREHDQELSGTVIDDDIPGFDFDVPSDGSTLSNIDEGGDTTTFIFDLNVAPVSGTVVIDLTSSDPAIATVAPAKLTLTDDSAAPNYWDAEQTVTVTSGDDNIAGAGQNYMITVAVDAAKSSGEYAGIRSILSGTVNDDETAGFTLIPSGGSSLSNLDEGSNTLTFTVILDVQPLSNVVLNVSTTSSDISLSSNSLAFAPGAWNIEQTVTVTSRADNDYLNGDGAYIVTVSVNDGSSDDVFDNLPDQTLNGMVTDDDVAGFTLAPAGGSTLAAISEGDSTTFTVRLKSAPPTNVTLSVRSNSTRVARVSVSRLVFSFTTWNVAQTVSVRGVEDNIVDGMQNYVISVAVEAGSDASYRGVAAQQLSGQVTNADIAGFTLTPPGGASTLAAVAEGRKTTTFTLVLDARPQSNVVFDIGTASSDISLASTSVVFTRRNWNIARTIAIRSRADNNDLDGDAAYTVTVSVNDGESDNFFDDLPDQTLSGMVTDDDVAGVTVSLVTDPASVLGNIDEGNLFPLNGYFNISLSHQPTSDVVVSVIFSDPSLAVSFGGDTKLTFTSRNWNAAQPVNFAAQEDTDTVDNDYTITLDVISGPADYATLENKELTGTIIDNDKDVAGFTIDATDVASGGGISEGAGRDFTVVLDLVPAPFSSVELTVHTASAQLSVNKATLTFAVADWNIPQTVSVVGVEDDYVTGSLAGLMITVGVIAASSHADYAAVPDENVVVTFFDNEPGASIVTDPDSLLADLVEGGSSINVQVSLADPPAPGSEDVVLTVTSSDPTAATVVPSRLTFTSANATINQAVAVSPVEDSVADGNQDYTITVAVVAAASNDLFDSVPDQTLNGVVTDDDVAGFTLVPAGGGTTLVGITEGRSTTFTVFLDSAPLTNVTLSITSTDTSEATVSVSTLVFSSITWSAAQTVSVNGVADSVVDGRQNYVISVAVVAADSAASYSGVVAQQLSGQVRDAEVASFTLTPFGGAATLADLVEGSATTTFTVVLGAQPLGDVVFDVNTTGTDVTVSPNRLTFAPGVWNREQTVTVTSRADNSAVDGDATYTVTVSVNDVASDNAFDDLDDQMLNGIVDDDEAVTFIATNINWSPENAGFLPADRRTLDTIDTGENQERIRVALSSAPSGPVTLTVISSSPEDITANVDTLTFTPTNFDQTVTVTTRENDDFWQPIKDITFTFRVITGPSDVPAGRVAVARGQLRTRPLQLISLPNRRVISSIQEDATGLLNVNLFQVVTSGTVTLTVSTAEESGVSFSPSLLEFVPITINGTIQTSYSDKRVQIRPTNDNLVGTPRTPFRVTVALLDGPEGYILNDRIWPAASNRPPNIHSGSITITEDDSPSLVVSPNSDFIVTAGTTNTLTVSLPKGPYTGNVVVTVTSSSSIPAVSLGQDLLTFTGGASGNWATPQLVAVRGVGNITRVPFNITLAIVDEDTNNLFDNLATQVVRGSVIDPYRPSSITTTPESQLAIINDGKTTTFTAQLSPPRAGSAVMTISSLNPEIATVHTRVTVTLASGSERAFRTTSLTVSASSVRDGRTSHLVTVTTTAGAQHVGTIEATDTYTVTVTGVSDLETSSVVRILHGYG